MIKPLIIKSVLIACIVLLTCATAAGAAAVGRLTLVEGRVDLLQDGKLPAIAVKVNDAVGAKDVIRTKSRSRAQITFIDNSTLTISPESRIAIEEFTFNAAQNKRNAVLKIFQGLALAVVNKIIKTEEPDFVVKTNTAIVGVRGTEFGMRLSPNGSTILNFKGVTQVSNISPQVSQMVLLHAMQGTTVGLNLLPTKPFTITPADQMQFMQELATHGGGQGNASQHLPNIAGGASIPVSGPPAITTPGTPTTLNILTTVTVPPTLTPTPQTPPPTPTPTPTPTHSTTSTDIIHTTGP